MEEVLTKKMAAASIVDESSETNPEKPTEQQPANDGEEDAQKIAESTEPEEEVDIETMEAYRVSEDLLKRLLYLCTVKELKYCCGGPKYAVKSSVNELIDEFVKVGRHKKFLEIVEKASEDHLIPHRTQIFYVLAKAICSPNAEADVKPKISELLLKLCRTDQEFFDFIKYVSQIRATLKTKLPHSVCRAIKKYYVKKTLDGFVKSLIQCRRYHGWTHNDLMRLAHLKDKNAEKAIVLNFLFGKKSEQRQELKCENPEAARFLKIMQDAAKLRAATTTEVAIPLIRELKANNFEQIGSCLRKNMEIWAEMIPSMPILEILQSLPNLYRWGYLKKDSVIVNKISNVITSPEQVKASGIHPLQVFIFLRNFEKGGRPLDPKLICYLKKMEPITAGSEETKIKKPIPIKYPLVTDQVIKCMTLACDNVQPLKKRILITIDTTDKMDTPCLRHKNITGTELAAAFVWYFNRVEEDVTVAVFKNNTIALLDLDKNGDMKSYCDKFHANRSKYLLFASPIEWATKKKKHFDIFLNIIQHHKSQNAAPKEERDKAPKLENIFAAYREKMDLPDAKLVTVCVFSRHLLTNENGLPNMFDVAGLDLGVPKIVEAFCRSNFS